MITILSIANFSSEKKTRMKKGKPFGFPEILVLWCYHRKTQATKSTSARKPQRSMHMGHMRIVIIIVSWFISFIMLSPFPKLSQKLYHSYIVLSTIFPKNHKTIRQIPRDYFFCHISANRVSKAPLIRNTVSKNGQENRIHCG